MKKLTMVILAACALSFGALAAMAGARHFRPEKRLEHMKKALNLTDAQVAQIKTVYENNKAEFQSDRTAIKAAAKGSDARKAAFKKMRSDMQAMRTQITPILTPVQQAKLKQMMAKHREHSHWHDHTKNRDKAAPQK